MLNPNECQSKTQLQLPWEVSETTSQLLTLFRREVKKLGPLQKHLRCLAWKANVECVTLRLLFLCSSYLDFPTRQYLQVFQSFFFQPAQGISNTHTHNICWFLTDFLLKTPSLLFAFFFSFFCVPFPIFLAKEESTVHEQWKCFVKYNLCPLVQPGQEIKRRHDRIELAVWLNQKKLKPHRVLI